VRKIWEITAEDIERWADRVDAAAGLPKLVEMRSDGGTRFSGWDGVVQTNEDKAFCPRGVSVWEFSVDQKVKAKLDEDFEKRAKTPPEPVTDPKDVTYVAVVARRYTRKQSWMKEKNARRAFGEVRLYDADDLATWLERAPAVGRWFAPFLGLPAEEVLDVEAFLEAWSRRTSPPLPRDLVLSGSAREEQAGEVRQWLSRPPAMPLRVQADTREEAALFVAAAMAEAVDAPRWLSRAMVVETAQAFDRALSVQRAEPLIVLPNFDGVDAGKAARGGAHVVLPLDRSVKVENGQGLVLEEIPYRALARRLVSGSRREEEAEALVRRAGGKLDALQRLLGYVVLPDWAKGSARPELFAMLLAGAWVPRNEADREVLAWLGGDPAAVEQLCGELEKKGAMRRVQEHWRPDVWEWVSPEVAWKDLADGLTETHRLRFRDVVFEVLGAVDPTYELPKEQRFAAAMYGKTLRHSGALREGLALSMVMAALNGGEWGAPLAGGLVYRLLAPERGALAWISLSSLLPKLAEAAPKEFLDVLEASLDRSERGEDGVGKIFEEEGRAGMGPTPHTGLLWALETLGWSPDRLMLRRVALAFARLVVADRDGHLPGKMMNRPIRSLSHLLSSWWPQSTTTVQQRLDVVALLIDRCPDAGWKYVLGCLSAHGPSMMIRSRRPQHRAWPLAPNEPNVPMSDVREQIEGTLRHALDRLNGDVYRWSMLLEGTRKLPDVLEEMLIGALEQVHDKIADPEGMLWGAIRRHLKGLGRDKKGTSSYQRLLSVYDSLRPTDPVVSVRWLFDEFNPPVPGLDVHMERERSNEQLRSMRLEALARIWERGEERWPLLARLAGVVKRPEPLGIAMAEAPFVDELDSYLFTGAAHPEFTSLLPMFGAERAARLGFPWLEATLRRLAALGRWDDARSIALRRPARAELWDLVDSLGEAFKAAYWREVEPPYGLQSAEEWERAIECLHAVYREGAAVQVARGVKGELASSTALHVLERLRERVRQDEGRGTGNTELAQVDSADIEQIFAALDREGAAIDMSKLFWLELSYMHLLRETTRGTPFIDRALETSPDLFVDLIRMMYRRRDEATSAEGASESDRKVEGAHLILDTWDEARGHPGKGLPSEEREARLEAWAADVLEKTRADGRAEVGAIEVAKVLARAPEGSDSLWPCLAARKLLESGKYPDLDRRLQTAKWNLRGMTSRAPDEGGAQERELAAEYRASAEQLKDEFPRTAAMLDALARTYEREAQSHDAEARRHRIEYGDDEPEPTPPPAPGPHTEPGGPLAHLSIEGLELAPKLALDIAPRINVLTGDNSLGKTLVLDAAWWALTGSWAGQPARPARRRKKKGATTKAAPPGRITARAGQRNLTALYEARHELWTGAAPLGHGLVLYARIDGGFSIWDPIRNTPPAQEDEPDLQKGYHFTQEELWKGKTDERTGMRLCDGFINDAVHWRSERPDAFAMLEKALLALSPPDEPMRFGLPKPFRIKDPLDYPTLDLPYGAVFAQHASAAVKRILGLCYALVWAVSSARRSAAVAEQAPLQHVTFLIDEVEAHLHPKWQRQIMGALLQVVETIGLTANVQILCTTHAPLILASLEPHFDTERDALFDFDLVPDEGGKGKKVEVEKEPWRPRGDVHAWLTSEVFGLKSDRSKEAEELLDRAAKALADEGTDEATGRAIHEELTRMIPDLDPFWVRWRFLAGKRGWLS
jgi:hypothetical protein